MAIIKSKTNRMLFALLRHGKEVDSKKLAKELDASIYYVYKMGKNLERRYLVNKRVEKKWDETYPDLRRKKCFWSLNPKGMRRTLFLIRTAFGEDALKEGKNVPSTE